MPTDHSPSKARRLLPPPAAGSSARAAAVGALLLAAALALAPAPTVGADKHAKALHPNLNVQANAARSTLLKQRSTVLGTAPRHAGKLVGGTGTPAARTIVTKRILPK